MVKIGLVGLALGAFLMLAACGEASTPAKAGASDGKAYASAYASAVASAFATPTPSACEVAYQKTLTEWNASVTQWNALSDDQRSAYATRSGYATWAAENHKPLALADDTCAK
jgi:hypothetical protein